MSETQFKMVVRVSTALILYVLLSRGSSEMTSHCSFNSMCTCKYEPVNELDDITCVQVPMARIPDLPNDKVTYLDILSSGIEVLENESFGSFQVEYLRFINNEIMTVGEKTFSAMSHTLKSLDLSFNDMDEVPFEAIKSLRHLDWVNFHGNNIHDVSGDWGHSVHTISNIFIGENDVTAIPNHKTFNKPTLHDFKRLTWLNIDYNKIFKIDIDALPSTLQTLTVNYNIIQHFPSQIIDQLNNLKWLYLRGNYISRLPVHLFRSHKRIDKLDLGENNIESVDTLFNITITIQELHLDSNRIKSIAGFGVIKVVRLYLGNNKISAINDNSIGGAGNHLEFIDLDDNQLSEVPVAISKLKRLKYLYLANNNISYLQRNSFENFAHSLRTLSLESNHLLKIPKQSLLDCLKLTFLNVGYNKINNINESDFETWGNNINIMKIENNLITELGVRTFRNLQKLKELNLSFNKLNYIHEDIFSDLGPSLDRLEMSFCFLNEEFSLHFLGNLFNLTWLSLDNNNIRTIERDVFKNLKKLEYLNLDFNRLDNIPGDLFQNKTAIRDLRFSCNYIQEIVTGTFSNLHELRTVSLGWNKISKIEQYSFQNDSSLSTVLLSNNLITGVSKYSFQNLPSLLKLDLSCNHLTELNLNMFHNISEIGLVLNVSWNDISTLQEDNENYNIKNLDVSHNNIKELNYLFFQSVKKSLRQLNIGFNKIETLDRYSFGDLKYLEILKIECNNVLKIERKTFYFMKSVQMLNLSHNKLHQLQNDQFKNLENLRIVDLSFNNLATLPREIFQNTKLEKLNLQHNEFNLIPTTGLGEVGYTLRNIDLSHNSIQHIDGTVFQETPFLTNINLAHNKLTILSDNSFFGNVNLIKLDLSFNPVKANFKEVFHFLPRLKHISIAGIGLKHVPILPFPELVKLNLSHNHISEIHPNSVVSLRKLRTLVLCNNKMVTLPFNIWFYLPLLKSLDVSSNPIQTLSQEDFKHLNHLQHLNILHLNQLHTFETNSLVKLKLLSKLHINTNNNYNLAEILTGIQTLQRLNIYITETTLTNQLWGGITAKLKYLEINGINLMSIEEEAFREIGNAHELSMVVRKTRVDEIKSNTFHYVNVVKHCSLDLANNKLKALSPTSFYSTSSGWESVGTRVLTGGITVSNNPLTCDCGLVWFGHWLRRWLRETAQVHKLMVELAQEKYNAIRSTTCVDSNGLVWAVVDLHPEDFSCHASALSRGGSAPLLVNTFFITVFVLLCLCF